MDPFWIIANSIATVVLAYILTKIFLKLVSPAPRPLASTERTFTDIHGKNRNFPSLFDRATVDISVVIPAYNEEQRLELMVLEAIEYLELQLEKAELIVVDDGSSDGTAKLAYSIASRHKNIEIRVLRLERNRGKGGAVVHGIMVSRGRYILFADADGATTFSDIAKLLTVCKSQDNCLALGSRAHMVNTDSVVKRSLIRNILMKGFHQIVYFFGIRSIKDTQCGFKMFTRKAAQIVAPNMNVQGWIFDIEMILLCLRNNIYVEEVPVNWHEVDGTKMNLALDSVTMLLQLLLIRVNYWLEVWNEKSGKN